jgi:hypothetical protein
MKPYNISHSTFPIEWILHKRYVERNLHPAIVLLLPTEQEAGECA